MGIMYLIVYIDDIFVRIYWINNTVLSIYPYYILINVFLVIIIIIYVESLTSNLLHNMILIYILQYIINNIIKLFAIIHFSILCINL